jgi:hypothetical protein
MNRLTLSASIVGFLGALAGQATAQPYYARGEFNGWGLANPMTLVSGVHHSATVTGLTPDTFYEYKCASEDWSINAPGSNGRILAPSSGEVTFHFYDQEAWSDGWKPDAKRRAGYDDFGIGWEIMGSFNGWSSGILDLSDQGGGLYAGKIALDAGSYEFKFRMKDSWDISIGDDFGNAAANNPLVVATTGDVVQFELDLPNGRWRTFLPSAGCKWDLDGDGKVCQGDLGILLAGYGTLYGQPELGELLAQFNGGCGGPCN